MKPTFSTPWLSRDFWDWYGSSRIEFCGEGIRRLFDLPKDAQRVKFCVYLQPRKMRIAIQTSTWGTLCPVVMFRTPVGGVHPLYTHDRDDERFLKRYRRLIDRTVYVECEYE